MYAFHAETKAREKDQSHLLVVQLFFLLLMCIDKFQQQ